MLKTECLEKAWSQLSRCFMSNRLSHAQLLSSEHQPLLDELAKRWAKQLLCQHKDKPCDHCQSCGLINLNVHPDICLIQPEKPTSPIKIDQIRALLPIIYTSPQLGSSRIVLINSAERMNHAAANALLKMLEEPPSGVYFLLMAGHISTIPATIISRCQVWYFPIPHEGFLAIEQAPLIQDLEALLNQQQTIHTLASKWSGHDLTTLLIFLYRLHAQMIVIKWMKPTHQQGVLPSVALLSQRMSLPQLFQQLDKINDLLRQLHQHISVNQLLALEMILLGFTGGMDD